MSEEELSTKDSEILTKYQQYESLELTDWERKAVEMRAEGYTYPDIVKEIAKIGADYAEQTLRAYFSHLGRLNYPLELWKGIKGIEAMAEAKLELKQAVWAATKTLLALLKKTQTGATRLGAAKEILDRNLGKPKQSMELSGEGFDRDAEQLEKIIGILTDGQSAEENTSSEGDS